MLMDFGLDNLWLVRLIFQRGLAAIYLIAFFSALNQFRVLLGEKGLLPVPEFLKMVSFKKAPSIFHWHYSDRFFNIVAWLGIILSTTALLGFSENGPLWLSFTVWLILWMLYLSIINVGQTFYAFGWESMLVEAGFFAMFLGPAHLTVSAIPILILRWMLFRTELGAGLIKLRHDKCWRDLTCLFYHHETQPLPNRLSWYFHHMPKSILKGGVLFSHFVQIIVPFGLFAPQPIAAAAAILIIAHQLILIIGGNYSWLNWLTVLLGITAFSDTILRSVIPVDIPLTAPLPLFYEYLLYALAGLTILLSIQPILNLFAKHQLMNYNYNPLHLVNSYGAFGSVTKERYEIVLEGTEDTTITPTTQWQEYEFKGKPGDIKKRPPQVAPYHLRLDWLMWFLPFSVRVTASGIIMYGHELWFMKMVQKLLQNDQKMLKLLRHNPFPKNPPGFVRARFYWYQFTTGKEKKESHAWWKRTLIDEYLNPVSLQHINDLL